MCGIYSRRVLSVLYLVSPVFLDIFLVGAEVRAQGIETWNKACAKMLKDYAKKPKHKAFAASNTASTGVGQGCGMAWGAGSKALAEESAKNSCKKARYGTCWIIRSD